MTTAVSSRLAERSAVLSIATLLSRVTGLLRITAIGAVLGPTFLANGFQSANLIPNVIYGLAAGHASSLLVVPVFVRVMAAEGPARAHELLARIARWLVFLSGRLALVLGVAAPAIAWVVTRGVGDARGTAFRQVTLIAVIVAPQIILYTIAGLGAAAQTAAGRPLLAAVGPTVENLGLMVTVAVVAVGHGTRLEFGSAPVGVALILGIGSTLSVAAHAAVQLAGAARCGRPIRLMRGFADEPLAPKLRSELRHVAAASATRGAVPLIVLLGSSAVAGGVLVMQVAYAVYAFVIALGARGNRSGRAAGTRIGRQRRRVRDKLAPDRFARPRLRRAHGSRVDVRVASTEHDCGSRCPRYADHRSGNFDTHSHPRRCPGRKQLP